MKLREQKFLADENIPPNVVSYLKKENIEVISVAEQGLISKPDNFLMDYAEQEHLIVITQDEDFSKAFFIEKIRKIGVIYLKPGHVNSKIVIENISAVLQSDYEVNIPFIIVAHHKGAKVKVRYRELF